jgi:stage V sporulation protein D (sporulation-specific penicillin-binding protein)
MEPYTGEILAMAQWPSFSLAEPMNPELFTDRRLRSFADQLTEEQWLSEVYKLWRNFHITSTFEPGSIFKPVVVAAALEENIINPRTDSFFCGAEVHVFGERIPCWRIYGHGGQDVVEVLAHSCNVAMVEINQRLGRDLFYKYRNDFGFGEQTGIDLPGEAHSGPPVMYTYHQLNPVEMATSAIGQGFNNTAIQAITAFAAVINGGNVMRPFLVSQIVDDHGNMVRENNPVIVRKAISTTTSDFMREAMHAVVLPGGTAFRHGNIEGYTVGGKTGTGQQGRDGRISTSYIAYTPVEHPEFIILGVLDNMADSASLSGDTVVPMVTEAMEEIIRYKNMRPTAGDDLTIVRDPNRNSTMVDYSGMQLVEVARNLNNLGVDYHVVFSGTVVDHHSPAAGQPIPVNAPVFLYLDPASVIEGEMTIVPNVEGLSMEVGEQFIHDALLTPVTFTDRPEGASDDHAGGPATAYPTAIETGENEAVPRGMIYRQFPAPGSVIQRGTQVKLRVRME